MLDNMKWSFGAELELADVAQDRIAIPEISGFDKRDITMVNSNGIAVDPKGKFYNFGTEINMLPTNSIKELVENFTRIMQHYPEASVNHRTGLHIHIRVPGLGWDLPALKKLQSAIQLELPEIIHEIEPLPPAMGNSTLEKKNHRMRKKSHQTFLSLNRLEYQLAADQIWQFLQREVPISKKGVPMWHAQSRCSVNIRQLRETDTIEFRHFSGTLDKVEFRSSLEWCRIFIETALGSGNIKEVWNAHKGELRLPKPIAYSECLELGYSLTSSEVPEEIRRANIKKILLGEMP